MPGQAWRHSSLPRHIASSETFANSTPDFIALRILDEMRRSAFRPVAPQQPYSADRLKPKRTPSFACPRASELGIFHTAESNMIRSTVWLTFTAGSDHVANTVLIAAQE